jgi:hypothetical protein
VHEAEGVLRLGTALFGKRSPKFQSGRIVASIIGGQAILKRPRICRKREDYDDQRKEPALEKSFHRFRLISVISMTVAIRRVKIGCARNDRAVLPKTELLC